MDRHTPFSDEERDILAVRAKRELRKRMRSLRAMIPESQRTARSHALVAHVLAMPAWREARTVALFASMGDEVQLQTLYEAAKSQAKHVALPRVYPRVAEGEPLATRSGLVFLTRFDGATEFATETSDYGIDEPAEESPVVPMGSLDLVVVPCLAVDPRGHRLGYGMGYYDQALPQCARAVTAVVCFDFQLLAELPIRTEDHACQWIVSDKRTLRAE
ncbi:MAG: 5-formyltetrahydrofolate cyclo-ligase [Deltaproteobacteria bacterium]|nr:5-formyltetrahydrofolate cyclo-ligase [Deltaproteobacteria bacterium]